MDIVIDHSTMKQKKLEDQLFYLGWATLLIFAAAAVFYFKVLEPKQFIIPCMWNRLFQMYCPGCGGTRAIYTMLHGQFLASLWYHPLVLYSVTLLGSFLVTQTASRLTKGRLCKGMHFHNWFLYGALAILLVNWIGKNLLRHLFGILL